MKHLILRNIARSIFTLICLSAFLKVESIKALNSEEMDFGFYDCCGCDDIFSAEAKACAFIPLNNKVHKIYHTAMPQVDLIFSSKFWTCWQAWGDVGYLFSNGHSKHGHDHTKLRLVPLSFGLNFLFSIFPCTDVYLGAGASYNFLHIRDNSRYVHRHVSNNAWGGVAKAGICCHLSDRIFFETSIDYVYQRFHFNHSYSHSYSHSFSEHYIERHDLNLDGLRLGAGLGITF